MLGFATFLIFGCLCILAGFFADDLEDKRLSNWLLGLGAILFLIGGFAVLV